MAEALPRGDGEFDAALSSLVIGFMRDPDRGVREMARVTRPGGTVAVRIWDIAGGGTAMLGMFWKAVRDVDPGASGERSLAGTAEGAIAERFERAGLGDVESGTLASRGSAQSFPTARSRSTRGRGTRPGRWAEP